MPELPEVETIKRELERVVLKKEIKKIVINYPKIIKEPTKEKFIENLKNAKIENILRKGKLLIFELSSKKALCIHLKLTGQLIYPGDPKKARISFKLSDGKFLDFRDQRVLGEIRLVDDWKKLDFIKNLGPEPFDLSVEEFKKKLENKKKKIKPLLLDQKFISGIGNLYAVEALFRAKISPFREAFTLSDKEKEILFFTIKDVLSEAIKYKGSSVDQYVQLSGEPGEYIKFHKVYDRENKPCFVCKTPIKRVNLEGRGTYFCPYCQK